MTDEPVLIGYFPKRIAAVPEWLHGSAAEEVCSVSECVSPGPRGWIDHWLHNRYGCFDSTEKAWEVVPDGSTEYAIFAWRLVPLLFTDGRSGAFAVFAPEVEPLPPTYRSLGFDVVSRSVSDFFECSPLSCNAMALEVTVNRHCLVEDLEAALVLASRFSVEEPEPGSYQVVEVLRHPTAPRVLP